MSLRIQWLGIGSPVCEALVTDDEGNMSKIGEVHLIDLDREAAPLTVGRLGWLTVFLPTGETWTAPNRGRAEEDLLDALIEYSAAPAEAVEALADAGLDPQIISS